jgi:hypothetical protein
MYFDKFDKIFYDLDLGKENTDLTVLTDITTNVRFKKFVIENVTTWEYYYIKDGETLENISEKLYGSPLYHWVLMILNEKYDYINDMPLSQFQLDKHVTEKYGVGKENLPHHYVDQNGNIVNSTVIGSTPVSNSQYEDLVNESKRKIKVLAPQLLSRILEQFRRII